MEEAKSQPSDRRSAVRDLLLFFLILFASMLIGSLLNGLILSGLGLDSTVIMSNAESVRANLLIVKVSLLVMHIFSFLLPALAFSHLAHRSNIIPFFKLGSNVSLLAAGLSIILLLLSIPIIQFTYEWNQQLPLPDWMTRMEAEANQTLIALIRMESGWEWLGNILLIAALPALGEELVFRGVIQQYGYRLFKNSHVSVWFSAILFSAIHLQFEGFVPRFLLGLLLGYIFLWTKSLWYPILIHFVNNAVMVTLAFFIPEEELNIESIGPEEIPLYAVIGSVIFLIPLARLLKLHFDTSSESIS